MIVYPVPLARLSITHGNKTGSTPTFNMQTNIRQFHHHFSLHVNFEIAPLGNCSLTLYGRHRDQLDEYLYKRFLYKLVKRFPLSLQKQRLTDVLQNRCS